MPAPIAPNVKSAMVAHPKATRETLLSLRKLILATAAETDGVGSLIETLKWGEPA